jgi:MHS family proline/betaine transporter-like MFS transporter
MKKLQIATSSTPKGQPSQPVITWPLIAGHVIENFDNTLYGFFAVMLAPIFFPAISPTGQLLSSYGAFAAGFLARPLGAIIFGFLGDKSGRKNSLLYTMGLVGIPTITIGLLPSYDSIGILAPILLVLCRLFQGLFLGGEFSGVNVYLLESTSRNQLGNKTGYLIASGVFGAVLATALGAVSTLEMMPKESWRIPFLIGGISAFCVYLFRRQISETEDFIRKKTSETVSQAPWREVLTAYTKNFFISCIIAGLTIMPLYLTTIFSNRLFKEIGYSQSQSMLLNMAAMFLNALMIMYAGKLADKIGFKRQIILGSVLTALLAVPCFFLILPSHLTTFSIYSFIFCLTTIGSIINGCAMPYIGRLFPTRCRYTGVALSVTIGQALFGGTTPLIASYLTDITGSRLAPGFWLMACSLTTTVAVAYANRYLKEEV